MNQHVRLAKIIAYVATEETTFGGARGRKRLGRFESYVIADKLGAVRNCRLTLKNRAVKRGSNLAPTGFEPVLPP